MTLLMIKNWTEKVKEKNKGFKTVTSVTDTHGQVHVSIFKWKKYFKSES